MTSRRSGEQKFVTDLQKWLKHNWKYSGPIEVKVSYEKRFNINSGFKPHQLNNLINAMDSNFCLTYKISDYDRMAKPYDLVCYHHARSAVAIKWLTHKTNKFYLISPHYFQDVIDSGKVSITEEDAAEIAWVIGELKYS